MSSVIKTQFLLLILFLFLKTSTAQNQNKIAVIPAPASVYQNSGNFKFDKSGTIIINNNLLKPLAETFIKELSSSGFTYTTSKNVAGKKAIYLALQPIAFIKNKKEAYELNISPNSIKIAAHEPHGIFNALQTLKQLLRNNENIPACIIKDEPAFSWRGYMIDVGRNYQPIALIKQQIDAMAVAKMNVFHFHATENVAWRFESKKYPRLNAPQFMTRNKGKYYSEAELKDIINYCKERFIEFVPEMDMPGHSEAFKRAMGFDMQTDSGLIVVKDLVKEFCDNYDFEYLHLGADEVKIIKPDFVSEIVKHVKALNKKIVAWWPGEIHDTSIIRNLWLSNHDEKEESVHVKTVDSRHTYLNHMDPLESVTTLFFRQYNDVVTGSEALPGATLCLWPDRKVREPEDAIKVNAVYPAIMAFAERTWHGGGIKGFISGIPDNTVWHNHFSDFEKRLLIFKRNFLKNHFFIYTPQSAIKWELFGPYDNGGDANKVFPVENNFTISGQPYQTVYGGTIVLKHFWAPLIGGVLKDPKENTTFYARTRIWSESAHTGKFWISFNNISRSPATDSLPHGKWNDNNGKLWVNKNLIPPPTWQCAGQKGDAEIPLIDEDYAYRQPNPIPLKKGWNEVWIKVPVTTFKGKDWQNPVKWMFTFAEIK